MTDSTEPTTAPVGVAPARRPRRPRADVIVWGVILLVAAALGVTTSLVDLHLDPVTTISWLIVGVGGLLVVAGVTGALVRSASARRPLDR